MRPYKTILWSHVWAGQIVPRETTRSAETRNQIVQALLVTRVAWPECRERFLEPEARQYTGSTMTGANNVERVDVSVADNPVHMGIDKNKPRAGPPVSK